MDAERRLDLDAAVAHFENLVADPCGRGECPDAGMRLGRLYARRLEPARAVETLRKALESAPAPLEARMLLLEQYRDLFLVEQATGPRQARQKLVVRGYRGRADRDPSPANLFDLGYLHALGLDPELDREASLRSAVSAWERSLALGDADAHTLRHLADAYARLGRWPEARRAAEKLVALSAHEPVALDLLADAADACGDAPAADRVRWQQIDAAPSAGAGWVRLVEAWGARVRAASCGTGQGPDPALAAEWRAELARQVEARGTTPAGQMALGWSHLHILAARPGEDDAVRALARFEESVEAAPAEPFAYWGMRRAQAVLVNLGRTSAAAAIRACEEAARRHPELSRAHVELGEALLLAPVALDRCEAAAASFARALQLDPYEARAHHRLATLRHDAGATGEAQRHARYVLALAPGSELASAVAGLLDALDTTRRVTPAS